MMPWRVGGSGRRQESALTLSIYPQHIRQHEASHHHEARPGFCGGAPPQLLEPTTPHLLGKLGVGPTSRR